MILKGLISTSGSGKARVILPDRDGIITPEIPIAQNVGSVSVNDMVAVIVFSDSLSDSLIIAKF